MKDKQIMVVVLMAALLWIAAWKHEFVSHSLHKAWKNIVEATR